MEATERFGVTLREMFGLIWECCSWQKWRCIGRWQDLVFDFAWHLEERVRTLHRSENFNLISNTEKYNLPSHLIQIWGLRCARSSGSFREVGALIVLVLRVPGLSDSKTGSVDTLETISISNGKIQSVKEFLMTFVPPFLRRESYSSTRQGSG